MRKTFSDPQLGRVREQAFLRGEVQRRERRHRSPSRARSWRTRNSTRRNIGGRNGTHQLTYAIANVQGRIAYPTVVYLDSDLNVLAPVQGYLTPDQMEPILNYFGEGTTRRRTTKPSWRTFKSRSGQRLKSAVRDR